MDTTIKITFIALAVIIFIIVKIIYDNWKYKERLAIRLKCTWGMPARDEYSAELMDNIKYYYNHTADENDIDDITCNDIELDSIYQKLNHTCTSFGEEYLYAFLRKPCTDEKELEERERLINIMSSDVDSRL